MKKIISILCTAIVLMSCGKTIEYNEGKLSTTMVINASPSAPIFNVLIDDVSQTATSVAYRANTLYLNVKPGTRKLVVRSNNIALPTDYVNIASENFEENKATTYVVYDSLLTPTSPLKVIKLTDDLTPTADGFIKVRYLPLAANAPVSDITFLRTSIMPNDSVTISNQSYIGPTPSAATITALSNFVQLPGGNYIIKQKIAGTQTVIAITPTPAAAGSFVTSIGGIFKGAFTVYSVGAARGLPLAISFLRNNP